MFLQNTNKAVLLIGLSLLSSRDMLHQDKSLTVTHNLAVFGGCGLVLSIITGIFGVNMDGMPRAEGPPYPFALFTGILVLLELSSDACGCCTWNGLKKPILEEDVAVRKLEIQQLVRILEQWAEAHAQAWKKCPSNI